MSVCSWWIQLVVARDEASVNAESAAQWETSSWQQQQVQLMWRTQKTNHRLGITSDPGRRALGESSSGKLHCDFDSIQFILLRYDDDDDQGELLQWVILSNKVSVVNE